MSKFDLNIIDKIRDKEDYVEYKSSKCLKFRDLFSLIPKIYPDYKEERGEENITLLFLYDGKKKLIREFNLYIRNGDTIEIVISSASYLLCDVQGFEIKHSENINHLYSTYLQLAIPYEVFIVKIENDKLFLVDVLDSGLRRYNECVNRLISRYNF